MSLLKEIQDSAVDSKTDVAQVLRKCRILASRLNYPELRDWVQKELDGYSVGEAVPDYRVMQCQSKGNFVGIAGAQLTNAPIPTHNLPERLQKEITTVRFRESVSALQNLAQTGDRDTLGSPWPTELIQAYAEEFFENMVLLAAHKVIPRNAIVSVIETVRNRVLNFALEIEAANPSAGEAAPGSEPVPANIVNQIFNNYIVGNVGNITSASTNFQQSAATVINVGDKRGLETVLRSLGVSGPEIEALDTAIRTDPPLESAKPFGHKVSSWIGDMLGKAARGALKVSTEVASETLTRVIKSYCGLPPT